MHKTLGVAGWSGSGKTTLIERLLPQLTARGLRVSVIKHCHHEPELDKPGKDSHRFRHAGASEVMVIGPGGWGVMASCAVEPGIEEQLSHLTEVDLVLLEGQKRLALPKLEVYRPSLGKPPRYVEDPHVIAVVSDEKIDTALPCLDLNDIHAVADFVTEWLCAAQTRSQT